jgi:hypothetical protein
MSSAATKVTAYKDPALPSAPAVSAGLDWANHLTTISPENANTLAAVVATLYPHETLNKLIYRRVIVHFDRIATTDTTAAAILKKFCHTLHEGAVLPFPELSESYREQALKRIEPTAEFFFVQRLAVRYLYDDVELWAAFGYEGASVHLGGYIKRGFDDLDWLPTLPNDI